MIMRVKEFEVILSSGERVFYPTTGVFLLNKAAGHLCLTGVWCIYKKEDIVFYSLLNGRYFSGLFTPTHDKSFRCTYIENRIVKLLYPHLISTRIDRATQYILSFVPFPEDTPPILNCYPKKDNKYVFNIGTIE
jgi:hypothetical protein